jgi:hypothetical protein
VFYSPEPGADPLPEPLPAANKPILIEKLSLLDDNMDEPLKRAFSEHEAMNPQYGTNWLANLGAHALDENDKAFIFIARLSQDDFVACPLKLSSKHRKAHSLCTFYTSAYAPIVCSQTPELLYIALFQHLAEVEKISTLIFSPMDVSSPAFGHIKHALAKTGWAGCHEFFCFGNWVHLVQDPTYESYLASRPSKLRNTVGRKTRKFLAEDRGELEIVHGGNNLDRAIEDYISVYNSSWKIEEPYPDFIPALLRLAAECGWLRLGIARYDTVAVASQIWLVCAGTAYIFKLAYHEDYKRLSAGTVLTAHMMQSVIEDDRVSKIDYLSGDDAYKADWMTERREQWGIAAFNPRSTEGLTHLIEHKLKRLLKMLLGKSSGGPTANSEKPTQH